MALEHSTMTLLMRAMCVGSVRYHNSCYPSCKMPGDHFLLSTCSFLLPHQWCITVLLQSGSRLQHMHHVLYSSHHAILSVPALQLHPPRSHLCDRLCLLTKPPQDTWRIVCMSVEWGRVCILYFLRELLCKWLHPLTRKPSLNLHCLTNGVYTQILEIATHRSLWCVLYLPAMLTEIYQVLPYRLAKVWTAVWSLLALESLRIFGWQPLPDTENDAKWHCQGVIAYRSRQPEIFLNPDNSQQSAMNWRKWKTSSFAHLNSDEVGGIQRVFRHPTYYHVSVLLGMFW